MRLSRCRDKIKAFLELHARELHTYLYRTKSLPEVFSVVWGAWERMSEKMEMAIKLKKKNHKEKWLDETILLIEESQMKIKALLGWV